MENLASSLAACHVRVHIYGRVLSMIQGGVGRHQCSMLVCVPVFDIIKGQHVFP
jgi:hypothetical protein